MTTCRNDLGIARPCEQKYFEGHSGSLDVREPEFVDKLNVYIDGIPANYRKN